MCAHLLGSQIYTGSFETRPVERNSKWLFSRQMLHGTELNPVGHKLGVQYTAGCRIQCSIFHFLQQQKKREKERKRNKKGRKERREGRREEGRRNGLGGIEKVVLKGGADIP
jgi:hypothetical protein